MNTDFPTRDVKDLLWRPAPLVVQDGLGYAAGSVGSSLVQQASEPEIYRRPEPARAAAGDFQGAWCPTRVDATTINLTPGLLRMSTEDFIPSVTGISVSASSLNYIYLKVTLDPTYIDGYCSGGGASYVEVIASTFLQTSDNTYGYIMLCTWEGGALGERVRWFNLFAELGNRGAGNVQFTYWTA
jgi:hypothetical protein